MYDVVRKHNVSEDRFSHLAAHLLETHLSTLSD